jgi:hypothetical protein
VPGERFTLGHLDEIDEVSTWDAVEGEWRPIRHTLGITSFGVNAWVANAGQLIIEEHDELGGDGHEELYLVIRGHATFTIGGETADAPAGKLVAIHDPGLVRKAVADEDDTAILAVGSPIGQKYEISAFERRELGDC